MYFILSTGRAGSRSIAGALDQLPGTVCRHHAPPELAAEATAFFYGEVSGAQIEEVLRATRPSHVDGKIYGEANLQFTLLFPILRKIFPEAQYVWLIRDGRDSVASMYYRGWYDETYPKQRVAWRKARLQGDRTGDFTSEEWARMARFERCCWLWRKYNLLIESQLGTLDPSLWTSVRLDRLGSSLPRLAEVIQLHPDRRVPVEQLNVARQPVTYWPRWTAKQREVFEQICGAEMDRWFPEWRSPAGAWRRLAAEAPYRPGRLESFLRRGRGATNRMRRRLGLASAGATS